MATYEPYEPNKPNGPDNQTFVARPARRRWNPLAALVLLLIVVAIGVWAYINTRPHAAYAADRDVVGYVTLNGQILVPPSARADVTSPYATTVDKVLTSVGSDVRRGDGLVKLAMPSAEVTLAQAKQNLQAAETAYANASRQYDGALASAQQAVAAARAGGTATTTGPAGSASYTGQDAVTVAEQALIQAQQDRAAGLAPYQQQLDAARQYYAEARSGARQGIVRAPIRGTVLALNAQPGGQASADPKTPLATIVNLDALQAEAEMTPEQAAYVKAGMPVVLTFADAPGAKAQGKVARITSRIGTKAAGLIKQQKYVALVDIKNEGHVVKPGMKPQVAIKTGEAMHAVAVPADAIDQSRDGRPIVHVMRGGRWVDAAVEPGISDGQYTQIKSGIKAGEMVKVTPNLLNAASLPKK